MQLQPQLQLLKLALKPVTPCAMLSRAARMLQATAIMSRGAGGVTAHGLGCRLSPCQTLLCCALNLSLSILATSSSLQQKGLVWGSLDKTHVQIVRMVQLKLLAGRGELAVMV